MRRRILAYFLLGLGFVAVIFFRRYSGQVIPNPYIFYLAGLVIILGAVLLLRSTARTSDARVEKQIEKTINELRTKGERIEVELSQCEIKEHYSTEERQRYDEDEFKSLDPERKIQELNTINSYPAQKVNQEEIAQTVLVYDYLNPDSGEMERFISRVIPKDSVTLAYYMGRQMKTMLYVDKNNRQKYYFDLDFLNE